MHTNAAYFQSHLGQVAARPFDLVVSEITSVSTPTCLCASQRGICFSSCQWCACRFYDPSAGQIAVGDHEVRDVTMASLRTKFGVVPQVCPALLACFFLLLLSGGVLGMPVLWQCLSACDKT